MSTRRARIKAITSLPVRRKNAENSDNSKNKQTIKETNDKATKSPRVSVKIQADERKSPDIKPTSPVPTEASCVVTSSTPNERSHAYDIQVSVVESQISTPKRAEKVPVITPNLNYKPTSGSTSPHMRGDFVSPHLPSPKASSKPVAVIVQRPATPIKGKTPAAHTIDENNELQITSVNVNSVLYNNISSKSIVSDDYNVPSVPESVDNDGVMDGIVPLQTESNAPKPIDLLKNEIISENAEVLFDPIIPLPSPSKVRPKLRPTPRLGPHRRNSVQGSASESEDESRRALLGGGGTPAGARQRRDSHTSFNTLNSVPNRETSRTRNDSVCSSVSQIGGQAAAISPVKEKPSAKSRRREVSRRMAAVRRRRETVNRDTLTMYDLIFYNPTSNPIAPNPDEIKAKAENIKDEEEKARKAEKKKEEKMAEGGEKGAAEAAPVPQIKLGPDGEIVLDKSSLIINQTDANREVSTVREGAWGGGGGGRYTRAPRTADWSAAETVRFYRALAAIGTDFSLMASLFPDRTRRDLKLKFKKEEKLNGSQVDKALRKGNTWDPNRLKQEFQDEREAAAKKARRDAERLKAEKQREKDRMKRMRHVGVRNSRACRALQSTMLPGMCKRSHGDLVTAEDFVDRALEKKKKSVEECTEFTLTTTEATSNSMATLTLINKAQQADTEPKRVDHMATLSRITTPVATPPLNLNSMPSVPANIETGSLVVLTVNDPSSPSKKMLQTYIAHSGGKLTPVNLPPTFLNSVVGYMKKGTPKSTVSSSSSPQFTSPGSVTSQDGRGPATPHSNGDSSPVKRKRMSSYTITQL